MSLRHSRVYFTRFKAAHSATLAVFAAIYLGSALSCAATVADGSGIRLELSPRICSLAAKDKQCTTLVHANWRSSRDESLCLVILGRADVKRCWEHYSQGIYSVDLEFSEDLTFQLKDLALENVLASEVLRVIREAILYRHRRRDPWNVFD